MSKEIEDEKPSVDRPSKFSDIITIIGEGKVVVVMVRIDDTFAKLKPREIYEYDSKCVKKTDADEHISHVLLFIAMGREVMIALLSTLIAMELSIMRMGLAGCTLSVLAIL